MTLRKWTYSSGDSEFPGTSFDPATNLPYLNNIQEYKYCTLRIKCGGLGKTPQGSYISYDEYIRVYLRDSANIESLKTNVMHQYVHGEGSPAQEGLAYNKWYDLTIEIPQSSRNLGTTKIIVDIGGAYSLSGDLYVSKITLHN